MAKPDRYNNETSPSILAFSEGNNTIPLLIIGGISVGSMLVHLFLTFIIKQISKKTGWEFDIQVVRHCSIPSFFLFPLSSVLLTLSFVSNVSPSIMEPIRHALEILLIIFTTWSAVGFVKAASMAILKNTKSSNSLQSRRLQTQLIVTRRIIYGLIFWIGAAAIFLTFPRAWEIGASILASASIVALLVGLAAKPSMENLIASLQIALTQPLLIDDYVVIDGQQGTVEEIQAQFIVVKTNEDRRIIVPLSRVINSTFENWTRTDEHIGMNFEFFVDYGIPLEDIKLYYMNNVLQQSEFWDHRGGSLSVGECKEHCMKLIAYMTASDIKAAWKLKDEVCNKLMEYLITTYPEYLPRSRNQQVEKRSGCDSMKRIVSKMEDPKLENGDEISEKKHFLLPGKE